MDEICNWCGNQLIDEGLITQNVDGDYFCGDDCKVEFQADQEDG